MCYCVISFRALLFEGRHERMNRIAPWPMGLDLCVLLGSEVHVMSFLASYFSMAALNLVAHGTPSRVCTSVKDNVVYSCKHLVSATHIRKRIFARIRDQG